LVKPDRSYQIKEVTMIHILLIANSAVDRGLLQSTLKRKSHFQIARAVSSDLQELQALDSKIKPDVILMIQQAGYPCNQQALELLRNKYRVPVIVSICEQTSLPHLPDVFVFPKIDLRPMSDEFNFWVNELSALILKLSRSKHDSAVSTAQASSRTVVQNASSADKSKHRIDIIVIGASTGGPQTLNTFLPLLPSDLRVPVVIVQHMPVNFLPVLTGWLQNDCPLPIQIAEKGEAPKPGRVYFAPDNFHLVIDKNKKFDLIDTPPVHNVKPAVSYLFKSVAEIYQERALGILFTGMGKDGAKELALIKEKGGVTMAQDQESCIIFGMPKEAIRLNGAMFVLPPEKIAKKLREFI